METTLAAPFPSWWRTSPGVLSQVSRLFSRKGYNIESSGRRPPRRNPACPASPWRCWRTTSMTELLCNQLSKMLPVHSVPSCWRRNTPSAGRWCSVKVRAEDARASADELIQLANVFRASIHRRLPPASMTLAVIGDGTKDEALTDLLREFGILEMVRTGMVALERGRYTIQDERKETLEFNLGKML